MSIHATEDINPPSIALDHVNEAIAGVALLITADITDDLAGVESARLFYRHKTKYAWKSIDFEARGADVYSAQIPAEDVLSGEIEYYATAKDRKGNEGKSSVLSVKVIVNNRSIGCGCS